MAVAARYGEIAAAVVQLDASPRPGQWTCSSAARSAADVLSGVKTQMPGVVRSRMRREPSWRISVKAPEARARW
jgi:hypothetical protein